MIRALHAKRPSRTRRDKHFFRPQIDVLEQRTMLAADLGFTPLANSAVVLGPGVNEAQPFTLAPGFTQTAVQRESTDADLGDDLGENTLNENGLQIGRFLFTTAGDGTLNRTDLFVGDTINLLDIAVDDQDQPLFLNSPEAIRWTPWGTLLVAESTFGGQVYEISNATGDAPVAILRDQLAIDNIEGIDIDSAGTVYLASNTTIYRFTPDDFSELDFGTLEVLVVADGTVGAATWDSDLSAATSFNGLRDIEIGFTDLGDDDSSPQVRDEILYVAEQDTSSVLAIDLDGAPSPPGGDPDFVIRDVNETLTSDMLGEFLELDVDQDGEIDFVFRTAVTPGFPEFLSFADIQGTAGTSNAFVIDTFFNDFADVSLLNFGDTVSDASLFSAEGSLGNLFSSFNSVETGNFDNATGFVGLRFESGGEIFYGFAEVTVNDLFAAQDPLAITIGRVGFQAVPDEAVEIAAGPPQGGDGPFVYVFVSPELDADFNDPVSLSTDSAGRVFIAEAIDPSPAPGDSGNDVWVAVDDHADNDFEDFGTTTPIADELGRAASLHVAGAAISGIYVNPLNRTQIYVNVSGSTSDNDGIFVLTAPQNGGPIVEEVDVGNGQVVVTVIGTNNSDNISISGGNLLTVKINRQVFKGLAPTLDVFVYGLIGSDRITASSGNNFNFTIFGGPGADYIATNGGDDTIFGEAGNDRILAGNGFNFVSGGDGNDSISGGMDDDIIFGDDGNDRLSGGAGNDLIDGGAGNDGVSGGFGDDDLFGGSGNDTIDGYFGDDLVVGGSGNDYLRGGSDQDVILGGSGADVLLGGDGDDLLISDLTSADDDPAALAGLVELWFFNSFADDRDQQVLDYLDGINGGDGITSDNARDSLDGGGGDDLFFFFGPQDRVRFVQDDDDAINLNA